MKRKNVKDDKEKQTNTHSSTPVRWLENIQSCFTVNSGAFIFYILLECGLPEYVHIIVQFDCFCWFHFKLYIMVMKIVTSKKEVSSVSI